MDAADRAREALATDWVRAMFTRPSELPGPDAFAVRVDLTYRLEMAKRDAPKLAVVTAVADAPPDHTSGA